MRAAIIAGEFYIGTRNTCLRSKNFISKKQRKDWESRSRTRRILDWFQQKKLEPIPLDQETIWHKVADKENVEEKLREIGEDVILFGEIVGYGVQDLHYGFATPKLFVYDIQLRNSSGQFRYLDSYSTKAMCASMFDYVPVLYQGPFSMDVVEQYKSGRDTLSNSHVREGVVIETAVPRWDYVYGLGRVKLKAISEKYLFRKNATDKEE